MKVNNIEVIQSYVLTAAKYKFSVHEKRILYRLVQIVQAQTEGQKLDKHFTINQDLFGDYKVTLPISSLNKDGGREYKKILDALTDLRNKTIEYDDGKVWELIGFIEKPKVIYAGHVEFEVNPRIYDAILNFSKGFRKLDFATVFNLESTYSMRLYELLAGQLTPLTFTIDDLREKWGLKDKYKQTYDFFKRTIDPAKKELDKSSPISFTYKTNKIGKKVISITLFPTKTGKVDEALEKKKLVKKISLGWELKREFINYLKDKFDFTDSEIKRNVDDFSRLQDEHEDPLLFMNRVKGGSRLKSNPKGYLIKSIRGWLKEKED